MTLKSCGLGFGFEVLGFVVCGLWFWSWGLRLRVWGMGRGVSVSG